MNTLLTYLASLMAVFAFCERFFRSLFIPPELRFACANFFTRIFDWYSPYCYFDITEINGINTNELYDAVHLYLSNSASIPISHLSLNRTFNSSALTFRLSTNDCIIDTYGGVTACWQHVVKEGRSSQSSWTSMFDEKRGFILRMKKKDKVIILGSYLDFIMDKANEIRRRNRECLLYTNFHRGSYDLRCGNPWESVPFKHPSTFETLAMDPNKKAEIMADLQDFAEGQLFYQKTGRAWKRGYLLYGPPGTGKSSMIAAMANYLCYDIYDLELTQVNTNSELRKLLMKTTSKSIIVIEDIDCSINLTNRRKQAGRTQSDSDSEDKKNKKNSITLSGLLNFTDGLWSCCGSERIFVFTTNHIEDLDPALLRSGRMDMHIYMSYCSFPALKILLNNYLGLDEGNLENKVLKELGNMIDEGKMTPADIGEVLIKNKHDKERALLDLLEALKS